MRRVVSHQMRAWGQGVEGGRGLIWAFSSLPVAFQSFSQKLGGFMES